MGKQYFLFTDKAKKLKAHFLVLSSVSLFIGLTEALPKKLTLIGLYLSNSSGILGWFIFFITLILLSTYIVVAVLELIEYYAPSIIKKKTDKTTGDTLGLTAEDCMQPQVEQEFYERNSNLGTPNQELEDINRKNRKICLGYKDIYIKTHDIMVIIFELIVPVVFSVISISYLYQYISCLK